MLCLALAGALLDEERERRLAAAGLLILGLALAAWDAGSPPALEPTLPERLGRGFLIGNGGLLLVGVGLVFVAVLRAPHARLRVGVRVLGVLGALLVAPVIISFLRAGGPPAALACAIGLWTAGAAIVIVARAPVRSLARRLASPPLTPDLRSSAGPRRIELIAIAGMVATLAGPHVVVVFGGVLVATWAAWLASHQPGARPLPVAPTLTLVLIPAGWLLATIAGPGGLGIAVLPQVPLSPAAELLLAPALLLAAWATAGLWPLHRQLPGALVAPAGTLLLARIAHPLVLDGLEYWRPLTVPLLVLGLWHAASWSRWPLVIAGVGILAVAGGTPVPTAGWAALLAISIALELDSAMDLAPPRTILVRAASWPPATIAGVMVLEEVLRGEVVYTTLGILVLALIVAGGGAIAEGSVSAAR
jgi:hypothetical protein